MVPAGSYPIVIFTGIRTGTFKTTLLPNGYSLSYQGNKVLLNVPVAFTAGNLQKAGLGVQTISGDDEFIVYPNPAQNIVTVRMKNNLSISALGIYTSNGILLKSVSVTGKNAINIEVTDLPSGTYFIRSISDASQSATILKL